MRKQNPNCLDIIRLEGKWAQVIGLAGNKADVKYLDDCSHMHIDLQDYQLTNIFDKPISLLEEALGFENLLTVEEIENTQWSPEQQQYPHLKKYITVFGEYVRKEDFSS